ncbi:MAG: helix-turn-helix transcriptional regulator [Chthoniobacteraceae bacterium]
MNAVELSFALREFRDTTGYTDAESAATLGLSLSAFCDLKNLRRVPKPPRLAEIARRLRGQSARKQNACAAAADFAAKLSAWRESGGLSQNLAGKALGVTAATVHAWEHLIKAPGPRTLLRVLPILCAPPPSKPSRRDLDFGPRLRAWRKASRRDQRQACALLGISDKATLSHYERSRAMPCASRLASIEQIIARGPALSADGHAEIALPQRLRAWRKARGLDQSQACALLGIPDKRTLSDYERGDARPRPTRLAQIEATIAGAAALPAALDDLERMRQRLAERQARCRRWETRLERERRTIENLARAIERRQTEAASLRALS